MVNVSAAKPDLPPTVAELRETIEQWNKTSCHFGSALDELCALASRAAEAQKERDRALDGAAHLDNILEGIEHALGDRMKGEHGRAEARHIEVLLADLAAAQKERDELRLIREGWIHDYRDLEKQFHAAKAEGARAVVEELEAIDEELGVQFMASHDCRRVVCERIRELRAAQPQPTTAEPASVRKGDEVLSEFMAQIDADGSPTKGGRALRELCRRALGEL